MSYGHFDEAGRLLSVFDHPDDTLGLIPLPEWVGWGACPGPGYRYQQVEHTFAWVDQRTLAEARAAAWERVKARRAQLDAMPVRVDDIELDGDERSRIDMLGAVVAMMITGQAERDWRCTDNVMRTLSAAQIQRAALTIADRRQALIDTTDALWQQLLASASNAEADLVVWPE